MEIPIFARVETVVTSLAVAGVLSSGELTDTLLVFIPAAMLDGTV